MQCLYKYRWVKLPRACLPTGKGLMGAWARLASRAAFRKGIATYCGHVNPVIPGMWSGGIVGLKSILGIRNRDSALSKLSLLNEMGLVKFFLDPNTKHLTYQLSDWIVEYSGAECIPGTVYTTPGYGFLCVPRNLTEKLLHQYYVLEDSDAWLDLWLHTVSMDPRNAFSFFAPVCQYGKYGVFLTLETLGQRWGWEKTKVWRFLQKHEDVFTLYRLPGSYGCLIFNKLYPCDQEILLPTVEDINRILAYVHHCSQDCVRRGSLREHMSRMVVWYSRRYLRSVGMLPSSGAQKARVALFSSLYRAYLSLCWNWKNGKYDCPNYGLRESVGQCSNTIRGPCVTVDLSIVAKEYFTYG
ncbi:MAG: hypothetical protein IIY43_07340 [Oscillospiraceae bacterium]|nr:hypothetical protein [Oscillospiraceae bacterium]